LNGLVGAGKLTNTANAVLAFLLNTVGRNLATTASTVYDWVSGNRLANAFWAIASSSGGNRSYADGVRGLVNAGKLGTGLKDIYNFLTTVLNPDDIIRTLKDLGFTVSAPGGTISIPGVTITVSTSGGSVQVGGVKVSW
jgi:hypothetical protein